MKLMVFDVAAESGGALSVLNDFYDNYKSDKTNNYIFVISKPEMKETESIKVLRYEWIKKSWLHRLYFDYFIAPRLIREYEVDEVLSLQNIIIPRSKVPQTVYYHNVLPLAEHRFSIFEDRLLWVYQNILSYSIFKSIKNADKVIVQNDWMKKVCIDKLNVDEKKFEVMPPKINIDVIRFFESNKESLSTFFYPASGVVFKNHKIIVDACLRLKMDGINGYKVIFTLHGNETKKIKQLYEIVKKNNLPIEFIGQISRELTFDYYSKSVLIFPSYIESVGLPLLEARYHNCPIIASDSLFSHEILNAYNKVEYFDPFQCEELKILLEKTMNQSS